MNNDQDLKTILRLYAAEIQDAYTQSAQTAVQKGGSIDCTGLRQKLLRLMNNAALEGLRQKDFVDLVEKTVCGDICSSLNLINYKNAA